MQLKKCHEELNKRIYEHDKLVAEGSDKTDITLKVGSAEEALQESTGTFQVCSISSPPMPSPSPLSPSPSPSPQAIHDAEEELESCRLRADKARENLRQVGGVTVSLVVTA